jgi:hypothetical protein
MATHAAQSQGLSCTVIFLPRAPTRVSRSAGANPRNWMCARSARTAATCEAESFMKIAR